MKIKFWGTRGSIPKPGKSTIEYGGNTTCLEVVSDKGDEYIFDAGTGIMELGMDLMKRYDGESLEAKVFLTHKHWDHVQGFPFFVPAYVPGNTIKIYSGDAETTKKDLEDVINKQDGVETNRYAKKDIKKKVPLNTERVTNKNNEKNKVKGLFEHQQQTPYFPVTLDQMMSDIYFKDVGEGEKISNGVEVSYKKMDSHPDGVFCYKISEKGKSIVFATDYEHDNSVDDVTKGKDKKLINWAKDTDILIYDGQYTPESYEQKKGWGHSTYEKGVDIAIAAGVKKLIFTHHDPMSSDEMVHGLEEKAMQYAREKSNVLEIEFAKEGAEYEL